jgi:AhpD family alkylhydroperoxidase
MPQRMSLPQFAVPAMKALQDLEHYVQSSPLESSLIQLVKMRASQMNGCAYCLDMHSKDARAEGESEQRLYLLDAWREAPMYSERERAALELTEAITDIAHGHVEDELYERVKGKFSDEELVALVVAVTAINAWNRLSITFRAEPGHYQPASSRAATDEKAASADLQ